MIKLKNILKEIDLGEVPFSDPDAFDDPDGFSQFIAKWNYVEEPNTEDEAAFISDLKSYIEEPNIHTHQSAHIASVLKQLLPLKTKFPGILDPASYTKTVYRGTTISIKTFIDSASKFEGDDLVFNTKAKLSSKGNKKFLSFSADYFTAENFVDQQTSADERKGEFIAAGLIPVVIAINASNPNLIFNSNITKFFNDWGGDEKETFYVGDSLTTDQIILPVSVLHWVKRGLREVPKEYQEAYTKLKSLYNIS